MSWRGSDRAVPHTVAILVCVRNPGGAALSSLPPRITVMLI
jgi:hypothetical protein